MAVGDIHNLNEYRFRETESGPMVWGTCEGCGKRALTSFSGDGTMKPAGCETCLRAKHGASLSYYGTDAGNLGLKIRHAPGLSGDVVLRHGNSEVSYKKGRVVLIPEPQHAEVIEPLRWVDPRVELPGVPKGSLDLMKVAAGYGRMLYSKVRPINHRGRRVAYAVETVAIKVMFREVGYWASWTLREGSDRWVRESSMRLGRSGKGGWWEKVTAAELTGAVRQRVKDLRENEGR